VLYFALFLPYQSFAQIVVDGNDADWQDEPVLISWINKIDSMFPESVCAAVKDYIEIKQVKAKIIDDTLFVLLRMWEGPAWPVEQLATNVGVPMFKRLRGYYTICLDLDDDPTTGWDSGYNWQGYTTVGYLAEQGEGYRTIGVEAGITLVWRYAYIPIRESYKASDENVLEYHSNDWSEYDYSEEGWEKLKDICVFSVDIPDSAKAWLRNGCLKICKSDDTELMSDTLRSFYVGHGWALSEDRSQDDFLEFAHELAPLKEYWQRRGYNYFQPGRTIGISGLIEAVFEEGWSIDMTPRGELVIPLESSERKRDELSIASQFKLDQNYPNPFNARTTINYHISKPSRVKIAVFNTKGQIVDVLVNEDKPAGSYITTWDGRCFSSGLYFYKLYSEHETVAKKLLLVK